MSLLQKEKSQNTVEASTVDNFRKYLEGECDLDEEIQSYDC